MAIQAPLVSTFARLHPHPSLTPEAKREILALPAGERRVLRAWWSADGQRRYASDGIRVRRLT